MANRSARERAEREARLRARSYSIRQQVHAERLRRNRRDDVRAVAVFLVVIVIATAAQVAFFVAGPGAPKPSASASASPTPSTSASAGSTAEPTTSRTVAPKSLSEDRTWTGTMAVGATKLSISLDGKRAPQAVANFVDLAGTGFYAGLTCHRLTTEGIFVLQCGDPSGDGTGGPGYTFGPLENVPKDGVYPAGTIAMARGTATDSQGSQFFLVYKDSELPAPGYTVFGRVTGGLSALERAVTSKGTADGSADGAPKVATALGTIAVR